MSDVRIFQQDTKSIYNDLKSSLRKLNIQSKTLVFINGLFSWLTVISLLLITWFPLGGVLGLPAILRVILVVIWSGCALWSGYVLVIRVFMKHSSVERMAFRIEQLYPELQDRLISSLQLWKYLQENKYGYSENFINMVIREAHDLFSKIDKSKVLSDGTKKIRRSRHMMFASLLPLGIIMIFFPVHFSNSLHAFFNPLENHSQLSQIEIIRIIPGNITVQPGDNVEIITEAAGPAPPSADLYYKPEKGEWDKITVDLDTSTAAQRATYTAKLKNLREPMEYYVSIAEIQSPKYLINVIQKPIISNLKLELQYPKYTRLSPQSLGVNVGDIIAPIGTKVIINAISSKDITSGFVVFDDDTKIRLGTEKSKKLTGSFLIKRSGKYYVSITDNEGQSNSNPVRYSINAISDQPPRVNIVYPNGNITLGHNMIIPLQIMTQDDYGIASISLHYQIEGQDKKTIIPLGSYEGQQTNIDLKYTWNLLPIQLFPEDVVSYYVEAIDSDNVSGPNIGKSNVLTARFPSLYEIYKQTANEQQTQEEKMEDILSQQEDVKKMVDDKLKDLKKKEEDWASKKELQKAEELQKKIEEQMKNLSKQVNETAKKIEENPLISTKILEKIQELRDLIDELANDEMKQILRKLSEAISKVDVSQQQKDLMAASLKQEEFIEKLDRIIDLFKNMQFKQKLEAATNQAKELVKQQTEIMEKSEQLANNGVNNNEAQAKSNELGDRETRIKNQTEQLQNDLDEIGNEIKERSPNIARMMDQLNEQTKQGQIPDQLQRASSELKNNKPANSIPFQKNALSKLSALQNNLQSAMQAMEGQDVNEMIAALRDATRKSLYLSHRHEEIMQSTSTLNREAEKMLSKEKELIDSLAVDQIGLADGLKKVASQLKSLSHRNSMIRPELVWNLERTADGMDRAAKAMEDKLPTLAGPIQKNSLATLNKSIEDMLDSIDQINSQAMPMPGMDDYMEQLRQLAEQQSQLNQSTQDADSQMRKQGITPSLDELLEKLAVEQSLIREATERLAEKLNQMEEKLGSLDEVAKEMQNVEDSLKQGDLNRNVIDEQKRILTRLLEYEKSLKKQDYDKKREARTGRDLIAEKPISPLPSDAVNIKKQLDTMLTPSAQEKWPTQYRELIMMYYKSLSNTIKTPDGAIK